MIRKLVLSIVLSTCLAVLANAQSKLNMKEEGITISDQDQTDPHPAAILDISSALKGVLFPRLTDAQRNAIPNPPEGLVIYNLDTHCMEVFNGTVWTCIFGVHVVAPSDLVAMAVSSSEIDLSWIDNSFNEEGFEVWYKKASDQQFVLYTTTQPDATAQSVAQLEMFTEYVFKIRGLAFQVYSEWSNEANAVTIGYYLLTETNAIMDTEDGFSFLSEDADVSN